MSKSFRRLLLCTAALLPLSACSTAPASPQTPTPAAAVGAAGSPLGEEHPTLASALAHGRDLGPVDAARPLTLELGLASRDQAGLDSLVSHGGHVSPADYDSRFGPDPQAASAVAGALRGEGLAVSWKSGQALMQVRGNAATVQQTFGVRIHNWIGPDGLHFYAPRSNPSVPGALRPAVTSITGFDNYPAVHSNAVRAGAKGVTPADMVDFYDMTPLRQHNLDGTGQTIYFIEIDQVDQGSFDSFSDHFKLPRETVQTISDPAWGDATKEEGEADLDVEVVHGIAPGAKLVMYYANPQGASVLSALQAIESRNQPGIVSSSVGGCEGGLSSDQAQQEKSITDAFAAKGWSFFQASGDRGAYGCLPFGDPDNLSTGDSDVFGGITSVGGTQVFLAQGGGYYQEAAWGEPIEQWGGGGGVSKLADRPAWQSAAVPGVQNQYSTGKRQLPDVSANADGISGWDVFIAGKEQSVGGTSAAAPCWAAIAALIDQDLAQNQLSPIGFANPALYTFASNPSGLPAPAFHDITAGTNLYYLATPGWDYATGLGSPEVAALDDDFNWYEKQHPAGSATP